jgi:signal transduction histidine kinase
MKLVKRVYFYTAVWIVPVMIIGGVLCFFTFEYINYEETDEYLTFEMGRFITHHKKYNDLSESYHFAYLVPDRQYDKPFFRDTVIYEDGDNEMVPYRELHFSLTHEGKNCGIVLRHILLPYSDIMWGTVLIVLGLLALMVLITFTVVNKVTGRVWRPFYDALSRLINFKIEGPIPVFQETDIDEFRALNETLQSLLKKISDDYRHNKEFNENASHELQTHLAIIRASAESLLNKEQASQACLTEINRIYSAVTHLSQVQKSLLLLSKITNREFYKNEHVRLETVIHSSLENFKETAQLRGIKIVLDIQPFTLFMDPGLVEILVNNLLKNAVKYNIQSGFIHITLHASTLIIKNSGAPFKGNTDQMFERFMRGENGNLGIGLAIVREICEIYRIAIHYTVSSETEHIFSLNFPPRTEAIPVQSR